jgi:hypothetical protein
VADAPSAASVTRSAGTTAALGLLLAALGYGVFAQGGFYPRQFRWLVVLLALALGAAWVSRRPRAHELAHPIVALCVALAAWSVISAALAGSLRGAAPVLGLLGCLAAVVLVVDRLAEADRHLLEAGILGLGVAVALDGWYGVVWHARPAALMDQGLWRAASPITYANGTAGLLVPLALVALAGRAERPDSLVRALAAYLLTLGAGATLSRAGGLAFAAGLVVLCACAGPWRVVRTAGPVLAGAAIAVGGLLSSTVAGSPARPAVPVACALLGAGIVIGYVRLPRRAVAHLVLAGVALAVVGAISMHPTRFTDAVHRVRAVRLTATSTDRNDEWRATLRLARQRPLVGIGPGQFNLDYRSTAGFTVSDKYAHNEFLQLLAEEGAVGLAVLVAGVLITVAVLVREVRRRRAAAAGAVSALTALVVHSSFDFLWHIPAVVLLPMALVALPLASIAW